MAQNPREKGRKIGASGNDDDKLYQQWVDSCTTLTTPNEELHKSYFQSVNDMGALRLYGKDLGPNIWVPAAGVPWYVTLFGRDSLVTSLENMMVQARFAEGALRILTKH